MRLPDRGLDKDSTLSNASVSTAWNTGQFPVLLTLWEEDGVTQAAQFVKLVKRMIENLERDGGSE